jgi:hypothetical protein
MPRSERIITSDAGLSTKMPACSRRPRCRARHAGPSHDGPRGSSDPSNYQDYRLVLVDLDVVFDTLALLIVDHVDRVIHPLWKI